LLRAQFQIRPLDKGRSFMPAAIIDGVASAQRLRAQIAAEVNARPSGLRAPGLAVVLVGDDPASQVYVRSKGVATRKAGMVSVERQLPATTSQAELIDLVRGLNADPDVDGILVQMPLPKHISALAVILAIDPAKDVDGLHPTNIGLLALGEPGHVACTPRGCMMLIRQQIENLDGLNAVVIGRSSLVGKPLAQLLLGANCTVTTAHSRTQDLAALCRRADVLAAAVGVPGMVRGDFIKPGAVVIDVGINRIASPDGATRLVGDVVFEEALEVAGAVTPVPGGVGPMTIACLLDNTLTAYKRRMGLSITP
jgi:methylenetetrahydrofolate dehydrogenase (NADP+)/methenyltetrahydrofolate cyclohydrolase